MPLFTICAIRVTPILATVQPQPPLEEIIFKPEAVLAPDAERAKLEIGRRLKPDENLQNVKFIVHAHAYTA